jgi:hypothetical protein
MRGGSFKSWIKKVGRFLKRHKVISRAGRALGSVGVPYASAVGRVAGKLGYGRRGYRRVRRRRTGGSLRLAGMGKIY